MKDQQILKFRRVDEGYYNVLFGSLVIGSVYSDPDAWSYARWMIEGDCFYRQLGGNIDSKVSKRHGFYTRMSAAHRLAVMQSVEIMRHVNAGN